MIIKKIVWDLDNALARTSDWPGRTKEDFDKLELHPHATGILKLASLEHFLVTAGEREFQEGKVWALGIQKLFRQIYIVPENLGKRLAFAELAERFDGEVIPREQVMIVGDRVDVEIQFGNYFGFTTVWMQYGKYANLMPSDDFQKPKLIVKSLGELTTVLS